MKEQDENKKKLDYIWQEVLDQYKLVKVFTQCSINGDVVKAKHKETGRYVIIKLIRNSTSTGERALKALRQLQFLRKMTQEKQNIFIMPMLDVIVPDLTRKDVISAAKQWKKEYETRNEEDTK